MQAKLEIEFCFYYLSKIQDVGAYNNTSDVVNRFYPCMMSGLAYYLSLKYSPERTQNLKMLYEDELLRAEAADGSETSTYMSAGLCSGFIVPSRRKT